MCEVISIIISIYNINSSILETSKGIIIDSWSSIDVPLKDNSRIDSSSVGSYERIKGFFFCPGIYLYPDSFLGSIKGTDNVFWFIFIWEYGYLRMRRREWDIRRISSFSMFSRIVIWIFSTWTETKWNNDEIKKYSHRWNVIHSTRLIPLHLYQLHTEKRFSNTDGPSLMVKLRWHPCHAPQEMELMESRLHPIRSW